MSPIENRISSPSPKHPSDDDDQFTPSKLEVDFEKDFNPRHSSTRVLFPEVKH